MSPLDWRGLPGLAEDVEPPAFVDGLPWPIAREAANRFVRDLMELSARQREQLPSVEQLIEKQAGRS